MEYTKLHGWSDTAALLEAATRPPAAFPTPGADEAARAVDTVHRVATTAKASASSRLLGLAKTLLFMSPHHGPFVVLAYGCSAD